MIKNQLINVIDQFVCLCKDTTECPEHQTNSVFSLYANWSTLYKIISIICAFHPNLAIDISDMLFSPADLLLLFIFLI